MERILIIEDEEKLLKSLEDFFRTQGYEAVTAATGEAGIELARKQPPAVVVLDVMLPDISGYDVCRCLKKEIPAVRVLMLSARGEEADKVHGLELGADDYMTKPFGVRELLARIKVLCRRRESLPDEKARHVIGDAEIDLESFRVIRGGESVSMTALETRILGYLLVRRDKVVTRDALLDEIWGFDVYPTTRTVDNLILKLRKKIEADPKNPRHIVTVYGAGYQLIGD
ncbi:MAG: response regulator transcription factor [PVC group bacterium]